MFGDLVTRLVPILTAQPALDFNLFDVMHHGLRENQVSNVFRWLLEPKGSHGLGEVFQQIFRAAVNQKLGSEASLAGGTLSVEQEVNTATKDEPADVADLVLQNDETALVIENYFTSDGHGHSFDNYLEYGKRTGKRTLVVLLCEVVDEAAQLNSGWKDAVVVTYRELVDPLFDQAARDEGGNQHRQDVQAFIRHIHDKFGSRRPNVADENTLKFIKEMCASSEALRYQAQKPEQAAEQFAKDFATQAKEQFAKSREVLLRVKSELKSYCGRELKQALNQTYGREFVTQVSANWQGLYQWTVNFNVTDGANDGSDPGLQIRFGPSAWSANERETKNWRITVPRAEADYGHLFLTRWQTREVRQSAVTMSEVLAGLAADDRRLHDEIVAMFAAVSIG